MTDVTSQELAQRYLPTIDLPELRKADVSLKILRLDICANRDSTANGNKYFKLKYNLSSAKAAGFRTVLSFGGAWSNHLHALAQEAAFQKMRSIGIVRSDESMPDTAMLEDAKAAGMIICPVSREEYRLRHDENYICTLVQRFDNPYVIPEGGSNLLGAEGCREIVTHLSRLSSESYDVIALPVGSGGTLAGVASAAPAVCKVIGYSVVRDTQLPSRITGLLNQLSPGVQRQNWSLRDACGAGTYGRFNRDLAKFVLTFSERTGIPVEPTYSGKLLYELFNDISAGYFSPGTRLIALHTGGMQGWRGQQKRVLELAA
jgi:1-aminocyclopropane-1-carboxylate deaminase